MDELDEIIGKLSAAALQITPKDDQIIAGHVRDSVAMLLKFRHQLRVAQGKDVKRIKDRVDSRLDSVLSEMKEGYDDSIVGFNEAWDEVRKIFADELSKQKVAELAN